MQRALQRGSAIALGIPVSDCKSRHRQQVIGHPVALIIDRAERLVHAHSRRPFDRLVASSLCGKHRQQHAKSYNTIRAHGAAA
eukprot:6544540-Prymnesium_polylepis.2